MSGLKPSEVLSRAADLIEPEGRWVKGSYGDALGPWCVVGALRHAAGGLGFYLEAYDLLARTAVPRGGALSIWNDAPTRTQSEVVEALRKAAELARKDGQ